MSIPRVGSGRSGIGPLVGSVPGRVLPKYIARVGNFLANFKVIDLVEKICCGGFRVSESKSGLNFVSNQGFVGWFLT